MSYVQKDLALFLVLCFVLKLLNYVEGVIEETNILVDEHLPDQTIIVNKMKILQ